MRRPGTALGPWRTTQARATPGYGGDFGPRILDPEPIRAACQQAGYRWRNRELDPLATIRYFLLQILHSNTASQHIVQVGQWAFTASDYCKDRRRRPPRVIQILAEQIASRLRCATSASPTWLGRRVWIIDGSNLSMAVLL